MALHCVVTIFPKPFCFLPDLNSLSSCKLFSYRCALAWFATWRVMWWWTEWCRFLYQDGPVKCIHSPLVYGTFTPLSSIICDHVAVISCCPWHLSSTFHFGTLSHFEIWNYPLLGPWCPVLWLQYTDSYIILSLCGPYAKQEAVTVCIVHPLSFQLFLPWQWRHRPLPG